MKNWNVQFNGSFFEVVPVDDLKEHGAGDECDCNPKVERSMRVHRLLKGTIFDVPKELEQPIIIHNSFDQREVVHKSSDIQISEPLQ